MLSTSRSMVSRRAIIFLGVGMGGDVVGLDIDLLEVLVPLEDAPPDLPAVGRGRELEQRIEQRQQRDEQDLEPFGCDGEAVRQVTHEQGRAVFVEALGSSASGKSRAS